MRVGHNKKNYNMETIKYKDIHGFMRMFKVTMTNPRNFKIGDKYIVVGQSSHPQIVDSDYRANKVNQSIVSDIRKVLE